MSIHQEDIFPTNPEGFTFHCTAQQFQSFFDRYNPGKTASIREDTKTILKETETVYTFEQERPYQRHILPKLSS
jgi:hypothetical protein